MTANASRRRNLMRLSTISRSSISFIALALIAACTSSSGIDTASTTQSQSIWDASDLDSYQWTYTSTCGENSSVIDRPLTVHVSADGTVLAERAPPAPFQPETVQRVLDQIRAAETSEADVVEVNYGEFGQPMTVNIDYLVEATDDEFCLNVSHSG